MNKTNSNRNTIDILEDISDWLLRLAQASEDNYWKSLDRFEEGKAMAYGLARDAILMELRSLRERG